jgi:hypothetical protein
VSYEIDHIFVCVGVGAPEVSRLIDFGLTEGRSSTHPGQGTSNRRFFFHNAMLELIWVHDEAEVRSPATERTRLFERWQQRAQGACPFGLCIRPASVLAAPPFSGWEYAPSYLPASKPIYIASNSEILIEPMLFYMRFGSRPDRFSEARLQPLEHRIGFREITRLCWIRPDSKPVSPALSAVLNYGAFSMGTGSSHALEIGIDHEREGKSATLMPELPITFYW